MLTKNRLMKVILKEIIESDGTYVEKEENETIVGELLNLFTKSLTRFVENLPDTE